MTRTCAGVAILMAVLIVQALSCNNNKNSQVKEQGEALAVRYCTSCHMLPDPGLLNKATWLQYVLPKMGSFAGMKSLGASGRYYADTDSTLSLDDWNKLVLYYYTLAPVELPAPDNQPNIQTTTPLFKAEVPPAYNGDAATTMVSISPQRNSIFFGDGAKGMIYQQQNSKVVDSFAAGFGVAGMVEKSNGIQAICMGVLYPSDERRGSILKISKSGETPRMILDSLQRPVHASYADFNGDGLEDMVVSEFGNNTGGLHLYANAGNGKYNKTVLRALPGAIQTSIYDLNKDGRADIVALMAQGDEGLFVYYNLGSGKFKEERLLTFSPSHGSNSFQIIDFNRDGFIDVMLTNGDNGDYPPIMKPYHGITIYLNDKANHFSPKTFLHINGVGKAIATDFDKDGDLDIASIAFFPDFGKRANEAFIFWTNDGQNNFSPSSIAEVDAGRWLTMDAGDIDGDGDPDIVLGNANFSLGRVPDPFKTKWNNGAPALLILRNSIN